MSPEHYTQNTEGAPRWCNVCARITVHAVSGGRIGRCTEHESPEFTEAQKKRRATQKREKQNPGLFPPEVPTK